MFCTMKGLNFVVSLWQNDGCPAIDKGTEQKMNVADIRERLDGDERND